MVVSNHDSILDGLLLGLFLPGPPIVVVDAESLSHPVVRFFSRAIRFVVLDHTRPLALKRLIRTVQQGETVAIFPQGRVTTTGGTMKIYDSAGMIAAHSRARIVPVHIGGTLHSHFSALRGNHPRRLRPRIVLTVQQPRVLAASGHMHARERRRKLADAMLHVMQCMTFEARPRQTLFEGFLDAMALYGRSTRIIEDVRQQPETYGDVLKASAGLAKLASRVTSEREIVGIMLPNLSTTVALVLGLTATGRVCAMLNYSASPDTTRAACVAAGIRTVITSRRFVQMQRLDANLQALPAANIVYLEDLRTQLTLSDKFWLVVRALPAPRSIMTATDPARTAVVLFTSGSEARSKGVAISHDAILANVAQMRAVIDFGPNDKYLNALPMYHTYGLIACTFMPLLSGTRLFLYTNPLHYKRIPEFAYTRECTFMFGTSTFLGHYGRQAHPYDFRSVRVVVSGGEKLHRDVAQYWLKQFGLRIMEGYGATECGPAMSLNTPLRYRESTVGHFLPGVEWQIVNVQGIAQGGALHVRAPNLMSGYYFYEQPGELHPPRSEVGAGWYNTGDVVDVDDDGYVTILGRVKRFAKIAGEMVSLELVERIAYTASSEHKHAATVEQVSGHGESTVLFTTDPWLDRLALVKAARQIGAQELAVARRIVKVASLPLLGSGKTDYVSLDTMTTRRA
jgi:acyl-[acyl-carrier-protein]-phospholipid O-acyltransferase/long-chain-fatty-acid--[acyl-carrier-protein] ligase